MGGNNVGDLLLKINQDSILWSREGNQGEEWMSALVTIPAPAVT